MEISVPVQKTVALEPLIKLVKLVARVFYDNYTAESNHQHKSAKTTSIGTAIVVLDALTRRQWIREEDLARDLKMHAKLLRKILKHFEEQKFVMRYHRKETAKHVKMYSAITDGRAKDNVRLHTHSYCSLDCSQIYDTVRYKLHRIEKKLKDELEDKNTVQEYQCPNCQRKYNALGALRLIYMEDGCFHCEHCNGELMECDKLSSKEEVADGSDNPKRRQHEKLKGLLHNSEDRLKPLWDQINRLKDLPFPSFESFPSWEARAAKAARENADPNDHLSSQGGYGSTPMPFLGETKVEVNLGEGKEDVKSNGSGDSNVKMLPPWMIKQGMNLTKEQRGEMIEKAKVVDDDDKKSAIGNTDDKDLKDAYLKACYEALRLKQQELAEKLNQEESACDVQLATQSSDRQVGMKSKREEEDVEWEEEAYVVAANGNYKADLNVEEEEDDVEWDEG